MEQEEFRYARIGTTIYKVVNRPMVGGGSAKKLVAWRYGLICQDEGKDYAATIPKFDGFCNLPNHINYQRDIDGFYNLYEPITHVPEAGPCPHILELVDHIFGEQRELGLDYLALLYLRPVQKLPVLILVSEERNTGKTTFLNFIKAMFQDNVTFNTNEDFRSQFNSDWAGKLVIAVDEVLLNRREDTERLKNLSTARTYKMEAKGKDRQEVEFFGKFILCSNNESCPVLIDPGETRFWIRKISPLAKDDTGFLRKLKDEIPAFLDFLQKRQISSREQSRLWFAPADLRTDALDKIIAASRNRTEVDIAEMLMDIMITENVDHMSFCVADLIALMDHFKIKVDKSQIRRILNDIWCLPHASNALSYQTYEVNFMESTHFGLKCGIGRYYTVTRDDIKHLC